MIGVWLVGAQGSLASTVVMGARAIARGLAGRGALVTELPEIAALPLVGFDRLVFGGWDVASTGLVARARAMADEDHAISPGLVDALADDLRAIEARVRPGVVDGGGPATRALARSAFVGKRTSLGARRGSDEGSTSFGRTGWPVRRTSSSRRSVASPRSGARGSTCSCSTSTISNTSS